MSEYQDPSEEQLAELMRALDPPPGAEERMQAVLFQALDAASFAEPEVAPEQSLTAEWIELFKLRPAANSALMVAAAVVLYFTTPLGALAGLIAR
jgi:hypothetical protein